VHDPLASFSVPEGQKGQSGLHERSGWQTLLVKLNPA
jgi:hypothetical protein